MFNLSALAKESKNMTRQEIADKNLEFCLILQLKIITVLIKILWIFCKNIFLAKYLPSVIFIQEKDWTLKQEN